MTISHCIKGREDMTENIIIKSSVQKRFDSFIAHGRVLFFSAPCGFGKTVLADALLHGRKVLRQSAADPDCAIPPSAYTARQCCRCWRHWTGMATKSGISR